MILEITIAHVVVNTEIKRVGEGQLIQFACKTSEQLGIDIRKQRREEES